MSLDTFPRAGARARLLARFERDLTEWLGTPEGGFAVYCAERDRAALDAVTARERFEPETMVAVPGLARVNTA